MDIAILLILISVVLIRMYWSGIKKIFKAPVLDISAMDLKENEAVVTRIGRSYRATNGHRYRTLSFSDGGSVLAKARYQGHDEWTNIRVGDKVLKTGELDKEGDPIYKPASME